MDLSEVEKFEQRVGKLKLSEAIRIGARLRPQGFGPANGRLQSGTSCALQAATEAATGKLIHNTLECIKALGMTSDSAREIWMMNDLRHQTREQIADWLESQGY